MKTHEPLHGTLRDVVSFTSKLVPDLASTVAPAALTVDRPDPSEVHSVLLCAIRSKLGIARDSSMAMEGRWGNLQNTGDRLDPENLAMLFDEGNHLRNGRSSSAWAKYADAFFRISLAVRSSRFSRSSCSSRARSSVVRPARSPASRAACRHQARNVSWEQPSFEAITR